MSESIFSLLMSLWNQLTLKRHRQFRLLCVLTILSAFTEVVSLGSVIPFIAAITQPESYGISNCFKFCGFNWSFKWP